MASPRRSEADLASPARGPGSGPPSPPHPGPDSARPLSRITSAAASPPPPGQRTAEPPTTISIPRTLWRLSIPLYITHPSLPNTPFITSLPRVSYLSLLLPRIRAFLPPSIPAPTSFHHEGIALRALPLGLLVDLYQPTLPWRLTVDQGDDWHVGDTFLNGVKEADFVRNGHAKQIMGMSKADTTALWNAVRDADYPAWARINARLLNPSTPIKHVPLRIYIPSSGGGGAGGATPAGSFRVMQTLVPPRTANRIPQTLGPTLRDLLPVLFPSSRDPVLANVVLHGAPVPFSAPLEGLMREAAYPDGWLCLTVVPL
ncbi:autophagy protein 5 [Pyricularia oryzae]|uniref:Autophagy protein 5 n=5 Tax=Pyricularia TaxID=48558 RepID=ATG5_PYRO7|nr:autophagy protein 5 [Pyricularia oryzae 70-15]Q525E4.1 RecName: Full=Autophagy protein 5 [Pyricularia oryzae 70-15]ELQ41317.1 autophagy protein 5 [Pyricularia oryzae Y34]KAH8841975.1 autophagy protein 5 [Pyricularia oryzae]KAI6292933.1 autophagy protein 5 [Pyricularia grisea]EHA57283.1 autophagy protein 5 [Pyricularia oryzae 70-15]KAH9435153.1 autophagy protein 5 [Pyricularia oryzae]